MKPSLIIDTLNSMTRHELRAVATKLNVPRGKEKVNTVANILTAISNKDARFTVDFSIKEKGIPASNYAPTIYRKKLRTHKPDKVLWAVS